MAQLYEELERYVDLVDSDLNFTMIQKVSKTFSDDFTFALKTKHDGNVAVPVIGETIPLSLT